MHIFRHALTVLVAVVLAVSAAVVVRAQITEGDDGPLRFGRFEYDGRTIYGFLSVGGIHELSGSFFDPATQMTGNVIPLDQVKFLAPVEPTKVIGVARNYADHGGGKGALEFFAKLPSSVIGPDAEIVAPPGSKDMHFEGEMVIVMGARARNVPEGEALSYVFGVTAGNDITERSFGTDGFTILKSKGPDTFAPLGPLIVPGLSIDRLKLETRVNGNKVQSTSTSKMIHSSAKIISTLSRYMTLEPGDIIYTGTPGTTAALKPGDVVEVQLEGVGTLRNTVAQPAE